MRDEATLSARPAASARRGLLLGLGAALIWGAYVALARAGVADGLRPEDFVVLRFGIAGLIMLPWMLRKGIGTLAGVGMFLKERNSAIRIVCADPMGAALYNYYKHGELKAEGSSITEGIGQGRVTANLEGAPIDDAVQIPDAEALPIIFDLVVEEGLVLGGSSGINIAGAIRVARDLGPGHTVVTVLCDYGNRYQSKLFNPAFLREKGLPTPSWLS